MNNRHLSFAMAIAVVCTAPLAAQQRYTVEECCQKALENNVSIRNSANSIEAAHQVRQSAFTKYFPTVSASGSAFAANKGLVEMDMGALGSLSVAKNGVLGGITLAQPVFAGGQIVNANKLAAVGEEAERLQQRRTANEVRLTAEQYFWQIVVIKEKLKTVQAISTMLSRLETDVSTSVKAGLTTRNDLLQVQLKQGDTESSQADLENNLGIARMLLAQYMGVSATDFDVRDSIPIGATPALPQELYVEPESALTRTAEYGLLEANVDASRLQTRLARGKLLPTVAVGAGYMYDNLMDRSHPFGLAYVTVAVPISGWWGGSHDVRKSRLEQFNAENTLHDTSERLQIGMSRAWTGLLNAHKQMTIANKSIAQATENLRLNEDYYKAGTTSMSDLLDAQQFYQQSRDKYVDAYAAYRLKVVEYLQATGR